MKRTKDRISSVVAMWLATIPFALDAYGQSLPCPPEQIQRLMPSCSDRGSFGQAVSLVDDRLAVGRYNGQGGRVSTYVLDAGTGLWNFEADLVPPGLTSHDSFGHSVELHHDPTAGQWLLAVGSQSRNTSQPDSGTAYVYSLNGLGQWVLEATVLPDVIVPYGWFGTKVTWATAGARTFLVVGAPGSDAHGVIGSVYVFERDGQSVWRQQAHLQAPDGTPEDAFGFGLAATEGNGESILAVGAPGHVAVREIQPGDVYFYRFDASGDTWVLEAQFQAPDAFEQDLFGFDVAVGVVNDEPGVTHRAAVGRQNEDVFGGGSLGRGAAYTYRRSTDGTWHEEAHLMSPLLNDSDGLFGRTVCLSPDDSNRLLIGATNSRYFGPESGSAFIFQRDDITGGWLPIQGLWGREQDGYDAFAVDLAFGNGASAGTAVVGALATQCPGGTQFDAIGAVYVFDLDPADKQGNCPVPVLTLQKDPECGGGGGGRAEIEVRWFQGTPGGNAGGRIALLYSRQQGSFVVPQGQPCAGTTLGLGGFGLQVAFTGRAGQFGTGRIKTDVSRSVCGGFLQLVDLDRCVTSNVVRIE